MLFAVLPDYGLVWDECLGDLFFGERYLAVFTHLDTGHLDFSRPTLETERTPGDLDLFASPFRLLPWEYYPFANTVSAACAAVFHRSLGWLPAPAAYHSANALFLAAFGLLLARGLGRSLGLAPTALAMATLFLHPRVFAHAAFDIKGVPVMCLFGIATLLFWEGLERESRWALLAAGVAWGLGLATKPNVYFIPVVWALLAAGSFRASRAAGSPAPFLRRAWPVLAALPVVAGAVAFLVWPWLWTAPIEHLRLHWGYISGRGFAPGAGWNLEAWKQLLVTMPPSLLAAFAAGTARSVVLWRNRPESRPGLRLLWVWLAVPLVRVSVPGAVSFDGIRHFLEFWPPFAAIAAIGCSWVASDGLRLLAARPRLRWAATTLVVGGVLLPPAVALARMHPHQIAYVSDLAGGVGGAQARGDLAATDFWGASYLQGVRWLVAHSGGRSALVVPIAEHVALQYRHGLEAAGISLLHTTDPTTSEVEPRTLESVLRLVSRTDRPTIHFMFVNRPEWENSLTDLARRRGTLVMAIRVDGGLLLEIRRL